MRKRLVILGASGSIGRQTIDICLQHPDLYQIVALSVGKNVKVLTEYLDNHQLTYGCVSSFDDYKVLKEKYPNTEFYYGDEGLKKLASLEDVDLVCNSLLGFVGLIPTIEAIKANHDVAIANKETLVAAGNIVKKLAKEHNVSIIPVDSEHSAIFQTLKGSKHEEIKRIIITASGGAFKNLTREQLVNVTKEDALKHPRWTMGPKITIDSASMMNKGFEVIEAHMLFDLPYDQIDVIVHPESIVHSMTEFVDHSVIAQLGVADMRMPIQYALTHPGRIENTSETLSLEDIVSLNFKKMDFERFPLLALAYKCGRQDGNMPAFLNGANEASVGLFLKDKISFLDIEKYDFQIVEEAQEKYLEQPTLEQIIEANDWAYNRVLELAEAK